MPNTPSLIAFAVATLILTATPGPGVLFVIGRAVAGGWRTGVASMLGIEVAEAVYIAGAAAGITAILATSTTALLILRLGGAAYLLWLGISAWRQHTAESEAFPGSTRRWSAFARGFIVQILNPKVALFFLAFFPQFIRAGHPIAPQVMVLGGIYLTIAVTVDAAYVMLASWLAARLARSERAQRRRARINAIMYFALCVAALVSGDARSSAAGSARITG